MSGRSSQKKGRTAELELAKVLQGYGYPVQVGEPVSYGAVPDLSGLPSIHIECKRCEQLRLSDWMQQATRDADRSMMEPRSSSTAKIARAGYAPFALMTL